MTSRTRVTCCLPVPSPKKQHYVSVAGHERIVQDTAKVTALWSESMRVAFPNGPEDPDIALICVIVTSAEYWNAPSSAWAYGLGYAKARLTGEAPRDVGENKVVNFQRAPRPPRNAPSVKATSRSGPLFILGSPIKGSVS